MITKKQAIALNYREEIHFDVCIKTIGPRGGVRVKRETWRINGAPKLWKTRPADFRVPIKYGFNGPYSYLDQTNATDFHLATDCPID